MTRDEIERALELSGVDPTYFSAQAPSFVEWLLIENKALERKCQMLMTDVAEVEVPQKQKPLVIDISGITPSQETITNVSRTVMRKLRMI